MNKIITISREFGSGGRELGQRLAEYQNVAYFDRDLLEGIAKNSGYEVEDIKKFFHRSVDRNFPMRVGGTFHYARKFNDVNAKIMKEQKAFIRQIAEEGDCVIVGRNADVILKDYNPFRIFVYASDMDKKVARCKVNGTEGENYTEKELKKKIKETDRNRSDFHDIISDVPWGHRYGYNICINTDQVEIEEIVPVVAQMADLWFKLVEKREFEEAVAKDEAIKEK